jgi:hypothetical protein
VPFGDTTVLRAYAFPEVTYDESAIALMTVTAIADSVLMGVAHDYFRSDLGDLRPLHPAVAEFHKAMCKSIQEKRARGPVIEEIAIPSWSVAVRESWVYVTDEHLTLLCQIPEPVDSVGTWRA